MTESTRPAVGFIGLGSQGGPMAMRIIAAGFPPMLWARRPDCLMPDAGTAARTAGKLAESCDHIGICVLDDAGLREVCDALLPAVRPGSRIVIHSTVQPDTCIRLAEQFAVRGIALIDAPVSGGGEGGAALALDRSALVELIKASSGRSYGFVVRARLPDPNLFTHGAKLLGKDLGLLNAVLNSDPYCKRLFFEKKKQKTAGPWARPAPQPLARKSKFFCFFLFTKRSAS